MLSISSVDPDDGLEPLGEWSFEQRPVFARSAAYQTLANELAVYLNGASRGSAFLIAANRGGGKTFLVERAVADLWRNAFQAQAGGSPRAPERPILVRLSAASMVNPFILGSDDERARRAAQATLQQIMVALYRSVAEEVAAGFRNHARAQAQSGAHPQDLPEMAARLTLELDLTPDLALLRAFWRRLGRLQDGVLWPSTMQAQRLQAGYFDGGLRELVAIATANQAFRMCIGTEDQKQTARNSAERSAKIKSEGRIDLKDAANRLISLAAGAVLGAALWPAVGAAAAAGAGVATTLLGALVLGGSAERSRRDQRDSDYTFTVDRSLKTLERDLPTVIERLRAAGLAPVFLIDELDKLEGETLRIAIMGLTQIKTIVADRCFFCFLTGRGYFEAVAKKLRDQAYPAEHTLFTHRLLLCYRPPELSRYVREMIVSDGADPTELAAAWVLTCMVLHRAQLNVKQVRGEVARLFPDGTMTLDASALTRQPQFMIPTAIQLAIEYTLAYGEIAPRVREDDAFAQLAIDVLYRLSRVWASGEPTITIDRTAMQDDLIERRGLDQAGRAAIANEEDVRRLAKAELQMAMLLTSFSRLSEALLAASRQATLLAGNQARTAEKLSVLAPLLNSIEGIPDGLLKKQQGHVFTFQFDQTGELDLGDQAKVDAIRACVSLYDELMAALVPSGMGLPELLQAGVLPLGLTDAPTILNGAIDDLRSVAETSDLPRISDDVLKVATQFPGAVEPQRAAIVAVLALMVAIAPVPSDGAARDWPAAIRAIERMLGVALLTSIVSTATLPISALGAVTPGLVETLRKARADNKPFANAIESLRSALNDLRPLSVRVGVWEPRLLNWLRRREAVLNPPIDTFDLTQAVDGSFPAARLRSDLRAVTVAEWSDIACEAFIRPGDGGGVASPLFAICLQALGFGASVLRRLPTPPVLETAAPDRPGFLRVYEPGVNIEVDVPPDLDDPPVFAVPKPRSGDYIAVIGWLRQNDAVAADI